MHTSVYIKMDAYDLLLLLQGVCQQLGILSYHLDIKPPSNSAPVHEERVDSVVPTQVHQIQETTRV